MTDPFGNLANQAKGNVGVFDGHQWQPTRFGLNIDPNTLKTTIKGRNDDTPDPNSNIFQAVAGGDLVEITQGSSAHPVTVQGATLYVSRYSAMSSAGDSNAAIFASAHNNGTTQPVGVFSLVTQDGNGDACGFYTSVIENHAGHAAFGYFADAGSVLGSAMAWESVTVNGGADAPWAGFGGGRFFLGLDIDGGGTTTVTLRLASSAGDFIIGVNSTTNFVIGDSVLIGAGGTAEVRIITNIGGGPDFEFGVALSNNHSIGESVTRTNLLGNAVLVRASGTWDNGIVFDNATVQLPATTSIKTNTIRDDTNSATFAKINGTKTYVVDVSAATLTTAWHGKFSVDNEVQVTRATGSAYFERFVGTGTGARTWGVTVLTSGSLDIDDVTGSHQVVHIDPGVPGANKTSLWILEGATPTLRQVTTFDPGAAGINLTAGQLLCVAV